MSSSTAPDPQTTLFNLATFMATHNSYSGGSRGSIRQQLDAGCRELELDLYNTDYRKEGDFRLGHLWAGNDVSHSDGNPASSDLADWLQVIVGWQGANPGHVPLTLVLDLKSNLSKASDGDGSLGDLQRELEQAFGESLWPASEWSEQWPVVSDLYGRVLVVLSGNQASRKAYRSRTARPDGGSSGPLFYEFQKGDSGQLQSSPVYAASHSNLSWIQTAVSNGKAGRAWGFGEGDTTPPPVTWPATDEPTSDWYQQYMEAVGALR